MKSFYQFIEILNENNLGIENNKWVWNNGYFQYKFTTNSTKENYIVEARPWDNDWWNVKFYLEGDQNPNLYRTRSAPISSGGSGETPNFMLAREVLTTTMNALHLLKQKLEQGNEPLAGFVFSATEQGRQGAYDAFINRFAKNMGATSEKRGKEYYLHNDNYVKKDIHTNDDDFGYYGSKPSEDLPPLSLDHHLTNAN